MAAFCQRNYVIEKETCINRRLFRYGVFVYLAWEMRTRGMLIWNSIKGFNLCEVWNRKLDFKYRAKSNKTRKPRKWTFFLLKPHRKNNVFSFRLFFRFWVSYATENLNKIKPSQISEFSILGLGQNRKLGNLKNCFFFRIKPHHNVIVSFFLGIF